MKIFQNKKALVLGGSGGIGFEIAEMLCENGADVLLHGQDEKKLELCKKRLFQSTGCTVETAAFKFSAENFQTLEKSALLNSARGADILCVCFGPFLQKPLEKMTVSEWQNCTLLNYALPGVFVSACLEKMKEKKWGRILLFGGTGTNFRSEFKTNIAYSGAKTATGILTQSAAANYAEYGITCNAILPGFVGTEYVGAGLKSSLEEKMPLHSLISTENIAKAAEFLLSNGDLNGVLLKIDRGWSPLV